MKIRKRLEWGKYFTFEPSKELPIYNWFYYKEGFSPQIIDIIFEKYRKEEASNIFDPFCGVGTSLLWAKEKGIKSVGIDASPLAVFVSRVKTEDYTKEDIQSIKEFLEELKKENRFKTEWTWEFELFPPRVAFPKKNLKIIEWTRGIVERMENQRAASLILLALLSIIPQSTFYIKDGGVLRRSKTKRCWDSKKALKKKLERMIKEIKEQKKGPKPKVYIGDARKIEEEDESFDFIITSPPYLNNIDYTKVYGLELSLLAMDKKCTKETRKRMLRSFIRKKGSPFSVEKIPIIEEYFKDSEKVLEEIYRVLKTGGIAGYVVSNSVIHQKHIYVDEKLGEIGERIGFEVEINIGLERWADVKPKKIKTRESLIIFKK